MPRDGRPDAALDRGRTLVAALEGLNAALARGDIAALTANETAMREAVRPGMEPGEALDPASRADLHDTIRRARAMLARCRAAGAAHALVMNATLEALGRQGDYGPQGSTGPVPVNRGVDLRARA